MFSIQIKIIKKKEVFVKKEGNRNFKEEKIKIDLEIVQMI